MGGESPVYSFRTIARFRRAADRVCPLKKAKRARSGRTITPCLEWATTPANSGCRARSPSLPHPVANSLAMMGSIEQPMTACEYKAMTMTRFGRRQGRGVIRVILRAMLLPGLCIALSSCGSDERSTTGVDVGLLSTDVHVSIAQHTLTLPFVALEDYAYRSQSFSLDRRRDRETAANALKQFLRRSRDPGAPLAIDRLSVVVRTYGWNDADTGQPKVCPLLTREWARAVCDNPWSAIQQALPGDRFRLLDLRRLRIASFPGGANCRDDGKPRQPLPQRDGQAVMVCAAMVFGGRDDQFHTAVVRIDGDLGAIWTVWRHGRNGETAEAMTEREGRAIVSFVKNGLAEREDWPVLHADMCRLRRPGSVDGQQGADCGGPR